MRAAAGHEAPISVEYDRGGSRVLGVLRVLLFSGFVVFPCCKTVLNFDQSVFLHFFLKKENLSEKKGKGTKRTMASPYHLDIPPLPYSAETDTLDVADSASHSGECMFTSVPTTTPITLNDLSQIRMQNATTWLVRERRFAPLLPRFRQGLFDLHGFLPELGLCVQEVRYVPGRVSWRDPVSFLLLCVVLLFSSCVCVCVFSSRVQCGGCPWNRLPDGATPAESATEGV